MNTVGQQNQFQAPPSPVTKERIGFGTRLGAWCVDTVFTLVIGISVGFIIGLVFGGVLGNVFLKGSIDIVNGEVAMADKLLLGSILGILILGFFNFCLEGFKGVSIGKMMLGICIGRADGTKATSSELWLRVLIKNIASVCAILSLILHASFIQSIGSLLGLIVFCGCFAVLGQSRQALHDMIAHTAVFKKTDLG